MALEDVTNATKKRSRRGCRGGRGKKACNRETRHGGEQDARAPATVVDAPRACPDGAPAGAVERRLATAAAPGENEEEGTVAMAVDAPRACPTGDPAGAVEHQPVTIASGEEGGGSVPQRAPETADDAPRACPGGDPAGSVERLDVLSLILDSSDDDEVRLRDA